VYEIIKHQEDFVMTLGILDTNIYNTYIVSPLFVWFFIYNNLFGGIKHESGVEIIDPFLYMFGCKYNNTEEPVQY
jgi:hypothetical protein